MTFSSISVFQFQYRVLLYPTQPVLFISIYAIQAVGPRFGCLHPLTSLKLFYAYSFCILRFGYDVISPTKSELVMMERCQLSIFKSILGLPSRTNSLAIHHLLGTLPMSLSVSKAHLLFLRRLISLPDDATAKAILLYRLIYPHPRSLVTRCPVFLRYLSLPDIPFLISHPPSKQGWKRCVSLTSYSLIENALDASVSSSPSLYDIYLAQPSSVLAAPSNYYLLRPGT